MKRLKVIVTGLFNESYTGTEREVESYLKELKDRQNRQMTDENAKLYKNLTQKSKTNHNENGHLHVTNFKTYFRTPERIELQEAQKGLGLKIKIEEDDNEFF